MPKKITIIKNPPPPVPPVPPPPPPPDPLEEAIRVFLQGHPKEGFTSGEILYGLSVMAKAKGGGELIFAALMSRWVDHSGESVLRALNKLVADGEVVRQEDESGVEYHWLKANDPT